MLTGLSSIMRRQKTRHPRGGIAMSLAVALLLPACGNLHLYSGGKDELASEAKTTFENVELSAFIAQERENRRKGLCLCFRGHHMLMTIRLDRDREQTMNIRCERLDHARLSPLSD